MTYKKREGVRGSSLEVSLEGAQDDEGVRVKKMSPFGDCVEASLRPSN